MTNKKTKKENVEEVLETPVEETKEVKVKSTRGRKKSLETLIEEERQYEEQYNKADGRKGNASDKRILKEVNEEDFVKEEVELEVQKEEYKDIVINTNIDLEDLSSVFTKLPEIEAKIKQIEDEHKRSEVIKNLGNFVETIVEESEVTKPDYYINTKNNVTEADREISRRAEERRKEIYKKIKAAEANTIRMRRTGRR